MNTCCPFDQSKVQQWAMSQVEAPIVFLSYLFSSSAFLLRSVESTQINERPGKLRRVANNLKRTLYSRRTNERRPQNLVPAHYVFHRLSQQSWTEIPVNTNNAKRTEGPAASNLL